MKQPLFLTICLVAALIFSSLGIWQLQRRSAKLELIDRVESRIHAEPRPLPPRTAWSNINARDHEYRRVRATGRFLHDKETFVDALTEHGPGAWVLTPLSTDTGTVLINRGYLPSQRSTTFAHPSGTVTIVGLMRMSEPQGRFLRPNDPKANRWFSRDVEAIASARNLKNVAPFFIDAEATPAGIYPMGGLTVVKFRNAHLVYAIIWLGLAALSFFGALQIHRDPRAKSA